MEIGCSSIGFETQDNKHLLGRTYDQYGNLESNKIIVIPRNHTLQLECDEKTQSYITTKYAYVGMGILGLVTPIFCDGINEKGLMGALLRYPDFAKYDTQQGEGQVRVNPGFVVTYLLGVCQTVEEVVDCVKKMDITSEKVFGSEIPVHYIFSDESGEIVVIEPDAGGMSIYRQSIGVLANSPTYSWQKMNLSNYVGLSNLPKEPIQLGGDKIKAFGNGGLQLPGDYSSPSRFVRMAMVKKFAPSPKDEVSGVTQMFHQFSTVDMPEGISAIMPIGDMKKEECYQKTLCMSSMCAESRMYYFTLATNRRIHGIDLKREEANRDVKYFELPHQQDILILNSEKK